MKKLVRKHPLAIRWFHWINFPLLALMIYSGTLIYWAYPIYRVGLGSLTVIKMNLSQPAWKSLHVNNRLADGMAIHFFVMWLFAINGVAYVLYTTFSGEWRELVPNRASLKNAWQTFLHDLHLRKEAPAHGKYNGAQQISYTLIVLMGLGSLLTGVAIYKPVQFSWLTSIFGGYPMARFFHFWLTVGYVVFFLVHVGQVIKTGWNNFRAMVIGYEVQEAAHE
ncbi:MAG TPA: cytochrome b/b6 domain-containing protein [Thermoanaerobaculia bacterium]